MKVGGKALAVCLSENSWCLLENSCGGSPRLGAGL